MSTKHINIALADDEPLFRKGIILLLQGSISANVLYEADNGADLIAWLRDADTLPDVIILDLKMPVLNGVETAKMIGAEFPEIKIIALSSYDTKSFVAHMIDIGAASYLVKNTTPEELVKAVKEVHANGYYYNDYTLQVIEEYLVNADKKIKCRPGEEELTSREIDILKLICRQYNAPEIAKELFLSTRTVEGHRNNLMHKAKCKNMIGLLIFALVNDYLTIESLMEQ